MEDREDFIKAWVYSVGPGSEEQAAGVYDALNDPDEEKFIQALEHVCTDFTGRESQWQRKHTN